MMVTARVQKFAFASLARLDFVHSQGKIRPEAAPETTLVASEKENPYDVFSGMT